MAEFIFELTDALYNEDTGEAVFNPTMQGELVRCKDCKHWIHGENGAHHALCDIWDYYISNGDFYCGCAERRE